MADKTVTIKSATNQELNTLLTRVRAESEALRLLRELKIKSTSNPNGPWPSYATAGPFSTEVPVSNGKAIKQMTDQELGEFINRLQKENELTRIISDIKEMNAPTQNSDGTFVEPTQYEGIDMNKPIDDLYHFGVKGMRWGVISKSLATGATAAKETSTLAGSKRKDKIDSYSNKMRRNAKELSDDDLKKIINRLNMEQQYRNLTTSDINVGRSRTEKYLERAGTLLTIGAAAAGLALTVKQLIPEKVVEKVAEKATGG